MSNHYLIIITYNLFIFLYINLQITLYTVYTQHECMIEICVKAPIVTASSVGACAVSFLHKNTVQHFNHCLIFTVHVTRFTDFCLPFYMLYITILYFSTCLTGNLQKDSK